MAPFTAYGNVKLISNKNCFASVPRSWIPSLPRGRIVIFQLEAIGVKPDQDGKKHFVSWAGDISRSANEIEFNALFATRCLQLKADQQVVLKHYEDNFPIAESCTVETSTENDYEMLSLNWDTIERKLLDTIRVIYLGQTFPIWVPGRNLHVMVYVKEIGPPTSEYDPKVNLPRLLVTDSEIVVDQSSSSSQQVVTTSNEQKTWHLGAQTGQSMTTAYSIYPDLEARLISLIEYSLQLRPVAIQMAGNTQLQNLSMILITGPTGVGKSSLLGSVCRHLRESLLPCDKLHLETLECRKLKRKRTETLDKIWTKAIDDCMKREPSLLILEDLDCVVPAATRPEQEMGPEASYYKRVALSLISRLNLLKEAIVSGTKVALPRVTVIATSKSSSSLHPMLSQCKGVHLVHETIHIPLPNSSERRQFIYNFIRSSNHTENLSASKNLDVERIAVLCDGFTPLDLFRMCVQAEHVKYSRSKRMILHENHANGIDDCLLPFDTGDFLSVLKSYTPVAMLAIDTKIKSQRTLADVGGMEETKMQLLDIFQLPSRYPKLFSLIPIRLQSAVLLYGAPGTGKTLLAEAIANECCMNFISIKGPELLSKYIGASEMAVRDLFARASVAKPCILFFDEFDAIAPRRGHDSTGVTDRVVNQLLTQLDGVEGLERGVYILAATSRPDLLDPALLRPGRFDKCILCTLPSEQERLLILHTLSKRLRLHLGDSMPSSSSSLYDLRDLARDSANFTAADLQSLLYTAQIGALHEYEEHLSQERARKSSQCIGSNLFADLDVQVTCLDANAQEADACDDAQEMQRVERLLSTLQLTNERNIRQRSQESAKKNNQQCQLVPIRAHHLLEALNKTRPSVSPLERMRYHTL